MRGSGSVKPSPLSPRESAQCILNVINLEPEPVNEGEVEESDIEDKNTGQKCRSRDMARNKRWNDKLILDTQFLSPA